MNNALKLQNQTGWQWYDGYDAPDGGWLGWLYSGTEKVSGQFSLEPPLNPGTYYVFAKIITYIASGKIGITLNSAHGNTSTDDRDYTKAWTEGVPLTISSAASRITITLYKTVPINVDAKYILRGLYITTNPHESFGTGTDRVIDYTYTDVFDDSPPVKGNIIENSGFDAAISHGWGMLAQGYSRNYSFPDLWMTKGGAHSGQGALRIPLHIKSTNPTSTVVGIVSKIYKLPPNKWYTLSAYVKTQQVLE
jgi:hypothetical protein